jgi:hypothetical protein
VPVLVLGSLAIHKDHPQKGIGTALLNKAILSKSRMNKASSI